MSITEAKDDRQQAKADSYSHTFQGLKGFCAIRSGIRISLADGFGFRCGADNSAVS
jgi:hypothetical protein